MRTVVLAGPADFAGWRRAARALLAADVAPEVVQWQVAGEASLFGSDAAESRPDARAAYRVPRDFLALAADVACHADPQRFALLYRLLHRLGDDRRLLDRLTDADVVRARAMAKAVSRDAHKMTAFVRFRAVRDGEDEQYVAWYEPDHYVLEREASFFAKRFAGMRWSILTPYASAHWDRERLAFGPGAQLGDAPRDDAIEAAWRTYYASIFNPARLNVRMMRQEMPQKFWRNLPEAHLIPSLVQAASPRVAKMVERPAEAPRKRVPAFVAPIGAAPTDAIAALRARARDCRACPLWQDATQVVFGEGPADARVVLIGEQPGDREDLEGRPFMGPAGELLDRALADAGVDRAALYLTNTVKHFKFEPRGKVRLHKRANAAEQAACRTWLDAELDALAPRAIACLGAMAAEAVFGRGFSLLEERGRWFDVRAGLRAFATTHPAYVLRLQDAAEREAAYAQLVADLALLRDVATVVSSRAQ
jgi:uracil-DNA glycosylase